MMGNKSTISRVFAAWKTSHVSTREEKLKKEAQDTLDRELGELSAKYNKEIDMLTGRLNEALRSLEEANQNKQDIQENLKKAFMRGVCALNFEAMSILKPNTGENTEELPEQTVMMKQVQNMTQGNPIFNSLVLNPVDENTRGNHDEDREIGGETEKRASPKKNIVFYQNPKVYFDCIKLVIQSISS